jgi:hypothetical protein
VAQRNRVYAQVVKGADKEDHQRWENNAAELLEVEVVKLAVGNITQVEAAGEQEEKSVGGEEQRLARHLGNHTGTHRGVHHHERVHRHHKDHGDDADKVVLGEASAPCRQREQQPPWSEMLPH